jgi:peptidoglycan/LPS O-acetylase OafA/YrhL
LLVFCIHFGSQVLGYHWLSFGWVGVDIFFVLSGFLITGTLEDTLGKSGALKIFYIKRTLRIFPLYFGFWFVVLLCFWPLHALSFQPGLWRWLLYIGNLVRPSHLAEIWSIARLFFVHHGKVWPVDINHFWSLCVEEQFYMVWPFLLLLLRNRRLRMAACLLGVSASLAARVYLWNYGPKALSHSEWAYHQTYLRVDGLLLGAFVALLIRGEGLTPANFVRLRSVLLFVPALIVVAYALIAYRHTHRYGLPFTADLTSHWTVTLGMTVIPILATGTLLFCLTDNNPISHALCFRPLQALGGISYGFYVVHGLPQAIFIRSYPALHTHHLAILAVLAWFGVSCGIASLSFRYFEMPFLRLKDRLAPHAGPIQVLAGPPASLQQRHPPAASFIRH